MYLNYLSTIRLFYFWFGVELQGKILWINSMGIQSGPPIGSLRVLHIFILETRQWASKQLEVRTNLICHKNTKSLPSSSVNTWLFC